jgi:uncharacterized protein (DUF736 family)
MIIGHFQLHHGRLNGVIQTLLFSADATLIPAERAEPGDPDYYVTSGDTDLGHAWRETNSEGISYILVKLDDPTLTEPILCRLVQTGPTGHTLLWDRADHDQRRSQA